MPRIDSTNARDPNLLSSLSDDSDVATTSDTSTTFPEDRYIRRERREQSVAGDRSQPRILSFNVKGGPENLVSTTAAYGAQRSRPTDYERPTYRRSRRRSSESDDSEDRHVSYARRNRPVVVHNKETIIPIRESLSYNKYEDALFPRRSGLGAAFSTSRSRGAAIVETDVQDSAVYRRLLHQPITRNLATVESYLVSKCELDVLTITDVTKAEPFSSVEHMFGINFAWSETHQYVGVDETCQYHWIHGQGKKISIENLKVLVTSLPQLDVEEKAFAITLLDLKKTSFESNRSSGGYLQPSTSRVNATPTSTGAASAKWAVFCNIPYISVIKSRTLEPIDPQFVQSQPITQILYPLENIRPVCGNQRALYQVGHLSEDSMVSVSHLWAVVTSSGTLVTLCPSSFTSLHEPYLKSAATEETTKQDQKASSRMVRIRCSTDEYFVFTFPLYACASYFALSSVAYDAYSEYYIDSAKRLIIRGKNEFEINEHSWKTCCEQQKEPTIEVIIANDIPSKPTSRSSSVSSVDSSSDDMESLGRQYQARSQQVHARGRRNEDQPEEANPIPFRLSTFADDLDVPPFFLWPLEFRDEVYVIPLEIRERYKSSRRDKKRNQLGGAAGTFVRSLNDGSIASRTKSRKKDLPAVDSVLRDIESKILRPLKKTKEPATKPSRRHKIALFYKASQARRKSIEMTFEEKLAAFTASEIGHDIKDFATWQQVLIETVNLIQNALDAFCPADYSHTVLQTFQNILEHLFLDFRSICEGVGTNATSDAASQDVASGTNTTATKQSMPPFEGRAVVIDQTKMTNLPVRWFEPKFVPASGCKHCRLDEEGAVTFDSWYQALDHLRQWHASGLADVSDKTLAECIVSHSKFNRLDAAIQITILMFRVMLYMRKLIQAIQDIRHGASDVEGKLKNCLFTMPEEMKEAYRSLTSVLVHLGYTASTIEQVGSRPDDLEGIPRRIREKNEKNIGPLLQSTGQSITTANSKLQRMNLPLDHSARQFYTSIGAPYLLAAAIGGLCDGTAESDNLQLLYAYEAFVQKVNYRIKRRPQRRLRTEIVECQDELTAILHVFNQQLDTMEQLSAVLDDDSFSTPSKERVFHYRFEREAISSHQEDLRYRIKTCKKLLSEFQRMEAELVRALEIESDDQDKAILAFTIVTIIFLPLSFATSFLGMNTTDIRDMNSSQWLFWAIALPLTSVTVAITILVAYRADYLRDGVSDALHAVADKMSRDGAPRRGKQRVTKDHIKQEDKTSEIVGDGHV